MNQLSEKIKQNLNSKKPKPKWQFILLNTIVDIVLILCWILAVISLGILIKILINFSPWEKFPENFSYFWQGFVSIPWEIIIIFFIVIFFNYLIVKKINFIYRFDSSVIAFAVIASLVLGYIFAENAGLHKKIADISVIENFYQQQGKIFLPDRGATIVGIIKDINSDNIVLIDKYGKTWDIKIYYPHELPLLPNQIVKINGIKENNNIKVINIQKINKTWPGFKNGCINNNNLCTN